MAKLITNISALMLIVLLVSSNGFLKAEAQTICFKGEADVEGVCVGVDGGKLCDVACKAKNTTWFGKCEVEEENGKIETHCHCYGPC